MVSVSLTLATATTMAAAVAVSVSVAEEPFTPSFPTCGAAATAVSASARLPVRSAAGRVLWPHRLPLQLVQLGSLLGSWIPTAAAAASALAVPAARLPTTVTSAVCLVHGIHHTVRGPPCSSTGCAVALSAASWRGRPAVLPAAVPISVGVTSAVTSAVGCCTVC